MEDSQEHLRLNDEQKTRLLSLAKSFGTSDDVFDPDEARELLLCDLLLSSLPVSRETSGAFPPVLRGQLKDLKSVAGETIGDLLPNPDTDIDALERIKRYAKRKGINVDGRVEEDAFLVLYCAAIASALAFHGKRITEHTNKDLQKFFRTYSQEQWVLRELRDLFATALASLERE